MLVWLQGWLPNEIALPVIPCRRAKRKETGPDEMGAISHRIGPELVENKEAGKKIMEKGDASWNEGGLEKQD